jgi:hypothetical protein
VLVLKRNLSGVCLSVARFATLSACSFPWIPMWLGTHRILIGMVSCEYRSFISFDKFGCACDCCHHCCGDRDAVGESEMLVFCLALISFRVF